MTVDEVRKYFGNLSEVCRQLDINYANMTTWKRYGYIPMLQQYRIAELTEGVLMPDDKDPRIVVRDKRREEAKAFEAKQESVA